MINFTAYESADDGTTPLDWETRDRVVKLQRLDADAHQYQMSSNAVELAKIAVRLKATEVLIDPPPYFAASLELALAHVGVMPYYSIRNKDGQHIKFVPSWLATTLLHGKEVGNEI